MACNIWSMRVPETLVDGVGVGVGLGDGLGEGDGEGLGEGTGAPPEADGGAIPSAPQPDKGAAKIRAKTLAEQNRVRRLFMALLNSNSG
jgi:hypothetical protein